MKIHLSFQDLILIHSIVEFMLDSLAIIKSRSSNPERECAKLTEVSAEQIQELRLAIIDGASNPIDNRANPHTILLAETYVTRLRKLIFEYEAELGIMAERAILGPVLSEKTIRVANHCRELKAKLRTPLGIEKG